MPLMQESHHFSFPVTVLIPSLINPFAISLWLLPSRYSANILLTCLACSSFIIRSPSLFLSYPRNLAVLTLTLPASIVSKFPILLRQTDFCCYLGRARLI